MSNKMDPSPSTHDTLHSICTNFSNILFDSENCLTPRENFLCTNPEMFMVNVPVKHNIVSIQDGHRKGAMSLCWSTKTPRCLLIDTSHGSRSIIHS